MDIFKALVGCSSKINKLTCDFTLFQDTVVALQALSEFATLVYSKDVDMRIDITTKKGLLPGKTQTIRLNSENHDVLQYRDVSNI